MSHANGSLELQDTDTLHDMHFNDTTHTHTHTHTQSHTHTRAE